MINLQLGWCAATSPVLTVHSAREGTALTAVRRIAPTELRAHGTSLPVGAPAFIGTRVPAAGFQASGIGVQAEVIRMAVVDRDRLTVVPGVPPRGGPV